MQIIIQRYLLILFQMHEFGFLAPSIGKWCFLPHIILKYESLAGSLRFKSYQVPRLTMSLFVRIEI